MQKTQIKSALQLTTAQQRFMRGHRKDGRMFLLDCHGNIIMVDIDTKDLRHLADGIFQYVPRKE